MASGTQTTGRGLTTCGFCIDMELLREPAKLDRLSDRLKERRSGAAISAVSLLQEGIAHTGVRSPTITYVASAGPRHLKRTVACGPVQRFTCSYTTGIQQTLERSRKEVASVLPRCWKHYSTRFPQISNKSLPAEILFSRNVKERKSALISSLLLALCSWCSGSISGPVPAPGRR